MRGLMIASFVAFAFPACAQPDSNDSQTPHGMLTARATVPVLCFADFLPAEAAGSEQQELGQLLSRCNVAGGYRVWVDYPPGWANVELAIGETRVVLDGSGRTLVVDAAGPEIRTRPVRLVASDGAFDRASLRFEEAAPNR